jgi:hypothetical protein
VTTGKVKIVAADIIRSGLLVHFSDETSTLFQDHFLFEARESNGNRPISNEEEAQEWWEE